VKIIWTDHAGNEVLHRVKKEWNILCTITRRKTDWIGLILRENCSLKHVTEGEIEGRIEVTGRRGRRHKQLLDDLKERRVFSKLKEDALDRAVWRTRFGRGCGPVVGQTGGGGGGMKKMMASAAEQFLYKTQPQKSTLILSYMQGTARLPLNHKYKSHSQSLCDQ